MRVRVYLKSGNSFDTRLDCDLAAAVNYYRNFVLVTEDNLTGAKTFDRAVAIHARHFDGTAIIPTWDWIDLTQSDSRTRSCEDIRVQI